jgi:hypothetical protein
MLYRNIFYSFHHVLFHLVSVFSSSKFIIYINYQSYLIIFHTTNFSLIPTSTTINYFIFIYITIIFYFYYTIIIELI